VIPPEMLQKLEIADLLDRYIATIDDDRLEEWPGFFTESCLYEIIPKENEEAGLPAPMRLAATAVHHALYGALILQPLLGFFTTNAFGFPMQGATAYLGFIDLPKFMPAWEGLANILLWMHQTLGWAIVGLLAAHIGAVIFHQAIRKDGTLIRMV